MDEKHDATRCKQCDHLLSFHNEDGCGTWLLGVRAVPLYRCACVVSPTKSSTTFPVISSNTFQIASPTKFTSPTTNEPSIAHLPTAAQSATSAQANLRNRLNELADGLRRTAAELKHLEDTLDNTLRRLAPHKHTQIPVTSTTFSTHNDTTSTHTNAPDKSQERRASNDRRRRHYAMIAERRISDRRTVAA